MIIRWNANPDDKKLFKRLRTEKMNFTATKENRTTIQSFAYGQYDFENAIDKFECITIDLGLNTPLIINSPELLQADLDRILSKLKAWKRNRI